MSSPWKFRRRLPACSVCERPFEDGEIHFSLLSVVDGEILREDPCWRCWKTRRAAAAELEPAPDPGQGSEVFWWRTRHSMTKKSGLALNLPAIEALFLSLEGRQETSVRELRYLLCLLLMRKRRLKLVRIRREKEGETFEVRRPRRQESLQVWVFDFTPERIDELRSQLVELFDAHEGEEGADADPDEPDPDRADPDRADPDQAEGDGEVEEPTAADSRTATLP